MKKFPKSCIDALSNACQELQEAHQAMTDYLDERSEKWKESDAGEAYAEWMEEVEGAIDVLETLPDSPPKD